MEEMEMAAAPKSNIWATPHTSTEWRVYVTELGDNPNQHIEVVDLIRTAPEGDVINLYITSCGGLCNVEDMYIAAISEAKATVVTQGVGEVASAATGIFLAGHVRICRPGSYYMFHNVQLGFGGDMAHLATRADFYRKLFKKKYMPLYENIMTEEEISELFERSGEIYFDHEEMQARLDNEDKIIQQQQQEAEDQEVNVEETVEQSSEANEGEGGEKVSFEGVFTIELDDGYSKTFNIFDIKPSDFNEYTLEEIDEIGECFNVQLNELDWEEAVETLISAIKKGVNQ